MAMRGWEGKNHKELSAKGGRNMPASARSFSKDPQKAKEAGRKGGRVKPPHTRDK